jgi:hypothetical protein
MGIRQSDATGIQVFVPQMLLNNALKLRCLPHFFQSRPTMQNVGAGDQNRTDVRCLGSTCSTIELHPRRLDECERWKVIVNQGL